MIQKIYGKKFFVCTSGMTCYYYADSIYSFFVTTKMYANDVISDYKISSPKIVYNDNIALLFINLYLKKIRSLTVQNIS